MNFTVMKWRYKHSRHFLAHIGVLPAGKSTSLSNRPLAPVDVSDQSVAQAQTIWALASGKLEIVRPDGEVHTVSGVWGGLKWQIIGDYLYTAIDGDATMICINPRQPGQHWEREVITLKARQTYTIPASDAPQSLFVYAGRLDIGSNRVVDPETFLTVEPSEFGQMVTATKKTTFVHMTLVGDYAAALAAQESTQ